MRPMPNPAAPNERDLEVRATQTICDIDARSTATERVLEAVVGQNGIGLVLAGFGRDEASGNVVLRFQAK